MAMHWWCDVYAVMSMWGLNLTHGSLISTGLTSDNSFLLFVDLEQKLKAMHSFIQTEFSLQMRCASHKMDFPYSHSSAQQFIAYLWISAPPQLSWSLAKQQSKYRFQPFPPLVIYTCHWSKIQPILPYNYIGFYHNVPAGLFTSLISMNKSTWRTSPVQPASIFFLSHMCSVMNPVKTINLATLAGVSILEKREI